MAAPIDKSIKEMGYAKALIVLRPSESAAAGCDDVQTDLSHFFVSLDDIGAECSGAAESIVGASLTAALPTEGPAHQLRVFPRLGLALGYVNQQGVKGLRAHQRVKKLMEAPQISLISPVLSETASAANQDEIAWGLRRLNIPSLWDQGLTGEGVVIGHLDTGIDGSHPALQGAIEAFAEFDYAGDFVANPVMRDSANHGTHTAGTLVGRRTAMGTFGVAPGAKLASAMVIDGGQVIDRIIGGMEWVIEQGARVLSVSLGLRGYTPAFEPLIKGLRDNNVLPVVAVGNEGVNTSRSPGNYSTVLSVGASDSNDKVAAFSSSQRFNRQDDPFVPDLVGPGVGVLSCVPGGGYMTMNGSSMATPHVAGLAALLLQAKPEATIDELEQAILQSCILPPSMPASRANRGIPDAVRALAALRGSLNIAAAA